MSAYRPPIIPAELAWETDPEAPEDNFKVSDVLAEMQASRLDASWYLRQLERNEATRLEIWEGKNGTGKKITTPTREAKPYNGAADHEAHLTESVIRRRNAMRVAGLARGALTVSPVNSKDTARAGMMKTVMRYYLNGAMKSQVLAQGLRAGAWADRYRHSLLYIGWKEERGVEPVTMALQDIVTLFQQDEADGADGMQVNEMHPADYGTMLLAPEMELESAQRLAFLVPGLKARGKEGIRQARTGLRQLRKGADSAVMYGSYVKKSAPIWEALVPYVDVFYPAETKMEDGLDSARWIARVKWMSAQQIKEQAAINDWDPAWVKEVLEKHKGRSTRFYDSQTYLWALSGAGVMWNSLNTGAGRATSGGEAQKHLYQIIELWDRSMTKDGLTGTYQTVLHADIEDKVAKRELRGDWHGMYPFVPFTFTMDDKLLLGGTSVPEVTMSAQIGIKAQLDSRTDAAAMTTFPPWTGPPELANMKPSPGKYLVTHRGETVQPLHFAAPDGRSIEIETSLRENTERYFGLSGKAVPDAVAMLMGQADMDWFLASISQAIKLTAQLVQQYMPPLLGARIAGTQEVFNATADDVRGGFDFLIRFDVRGTDMDWAKQLLESVQKFILPMDRHGDFQTYPLMEFGLNLLDPSMTPACLPGQEITQQKQKDDELNAIAQIFSGGNPPLDPGSDFEGRAQIMLEELQRSPDRQALLMSSVQTFLVFQARLDGLVNNQQQHQGENAEIGQTLMEDPLKQPSAPAQLLEFLKGLKVTWQSDPQQLHQMLPYLQQKLQQLNQSLN